MMVPTLTVRAPPRRLAELRWVCDVILTGRLGLGCRLQTHESTFVELECEGGRVQWTDMFFARADANWLGAGSAEAQPLRCWAVPDLDLQAVLGRADVTLLFGDGVFMASEDVVHLPIDITGSCFFMLARYEEAIAGAALDRHGRFAGHHSVVGRAGLLSRPLVDEWVELLWWALHRVSPELVRRPTAPEVWVTCDVDLPYSPGVKQPMMALRQAAAHLVRERSAALALQAAVNPLLTWLGVSALDVYDRFDWMMDVNEKSGQRITFFFICARDKSRYEGFYSVDELRIAQLIDRILRRGHEVALHASYASSEAPELLHAEIDRLRHRMTSMTGSQPTLGNRQHYLRWQADTTPAVLDAAGLTYDATLGYADLPGFRCGTCHPFTLFDLKARRALKVIERPLILMEGSVISPDYMNLGLGPKAQHVMIDLKETCRRFRGTFTLLWHNDALRQVKARQLYVSLIQPYGMSSVSAPLGT